MKKEFEILVIGELNVDLILNNIQTYPRIGAEILAQNMELTLGSSSAIFASNICVLDTRVAFCGKIGQDSFGNLVLDTLNKRGVNTKWIISSKDYATGASIILNYANDRAIITYPGAMEHLSCDDISDEALQSARHIHISSVFLQPAIKNCLKNLLLRAKKFGLTTSVDPQWDPKENWDINLKEILPLIDVFLPNESEILAFTRETVVIRALKKLAPYGNYIVAKLGEKGSAGIFDNKLIEMPGFKNNKLIDAIGAGDSFNAGFIKGFIQNKSPEECLKLGNLMGAINTIAPGGTGAFTSLENVKQVAKQKFNYNLSL